MEKDHAFAKFQLGKLLCQGEFVEKDITRGLLLLEELAQGGVSYAAYIAGKKVGRMLKKQSYISSRRRRTAIPMGNTNLERSTILETVCVLTGRWDSNI